VIAGDLLKVVGDQTDVEVFGKKEDAPVSR
jgi:hypothetical protein